MNPPPLSLSTPWRKEGQFVPESLYPLLDPAAGAVQRDCSPVRPEPASAPVRGCRTGRKPPPRVFHRFEDTLDNARTDGDEEVPQVGQEHI
jgi:hypothetical protein